MFAFVVGERNNPQASPTLHLVGRSQYIRLHKRWPLHCHSLVDRGSDVSLSDVHTLGVTV
jgi:hypothetical protein